MSSRARALAILLVVLIALPVTGAWRGVAQVVHCCGLPGYVRTANDGGPKDALPPGQQTLTIAGTEEHYMDWEQTAYDENAPAGMMIQETLTRPDNTFNPLPAAATSWSVDKSGLVWTIQLRHGMVWSDGTPITSKDWVFPFHRMARPHYDFERLCSTSKNMDNVPSHHGPLAILGVKLAGPYTPHVTR